MEKQLSKSVTLDDLQAIEEAQGQQPKKKKMTKEEKRERKLQEENEFKKTEMYTTLKRELAMSKKNYDMQYDQWIDLMSGLKYKELQSDLKYWTTKTDIWFREKNDKIERLLEDFREAEELNERSHDRRVKLIKYLEETYQALIESAKLNYETQIEDVLTTFMEEVHNSECLHQSIADNCDNIQNTASVIFKRKMLDNYEIFLDKQVECISEEINKRYLRRNKVLEKMKQMRKNLCDFVDLISDTSLDVEKYKRLGIMMQRSREYSDEARRLDELEYKQRETYTKLNRELLSMEIDRQKRLNDLKIEHLYYVRVRQYIEHKTELERSQTFEKMKVLSGAAYTVCNKLKEYGKFGELLLALAANCRKLETEAQKVAPYGDFPSKFALVKEMDFSVDTVDVQDILNISFEEFRDNINLLKNFWQRMARVKAQNMILKKQKEQLLLEKANLLDSLKNVTETDTTEKLESALQVKLLQEQNTLTLPCHKVHW